MPNRLGPNGDSHNKGMVDVVPVGKDCSHFVPNEVHPPPRDELPLAIAQVLQKWLAANPVRVRETLPIIRGGDMVGLFVWWERIETGTQEGRPESEV